MSDEVCEVVVTAPDANWLVDFTRRLVNDRLCASGHNFAIRSAYRWQGEVHDEREARAALHTRRSLVDAITARTIAEHPYQVPCVVALPITSGSAEYIQWILDETAPKA